MNKENIQRASELSDSQYLLKNLKHMVKDTWFRIICKSIRFKDYYSEFNFSQLDRETMLGLRTVITDYCNKRIAEIDKEIESL